MSSQKITFANIQRNVSEIANRTDYSKDVLFELLAAYGRSATAITKLRNNVNNVAEDKESSVLQRGVVYFKQVLDGNLLSTIDSLDQDPLVARYNPRYLIATDYKQLAAKDTKKGTTLDIKLQDIDRHVDFFYGWTGDEITDQKTEAVADRRAADKMKELYYEIEKVNRHKLAEKGSTFHHDLNVFFTRLLFCFFAEDTKVFSKEEASIFTNAIKDFTQTDGSDLDQFLDTLFSALDSEDKSGFTSPFSNFPYVNGMLFDTKRNIAIPKFNAQARKYILDCGSLNWAEINPDIFGSMFQSIVDEDHRSTHGMHYTSVPNIMKTIEPLFLDELREEFDKYYDNTPRLTKLHDRIAKIKVFDPACGSGNFLIIAYKELRKLEHAIIDRLYEDDFKKAALLGKLSTRIDLENFYGIEIDDFACEVAVLSLYLAKHQMNIEFEKQFGKEIKLIPLKDKANIVRGNSALLDWQDVCPNKPHNIDKTIYEQGKLLEDDHEQGELIDPDTLKQQVWDEIYLISNPPYAGYSVQTHNQKKDMAQAFHQFDEYKSLDYISIWLYMAAKYIKSSSAKYAFVTTNSVCQGEQVAMLWPKLFELGLEINFAYTSFKWKNSARDNAGVSCIIVSLRNISKRPKIIFQNGVALKCDNISPYLTASANIIVIKRSKPLSNLPSIGYGSSALDGGHLILSTEEKDDLIHHFPEAKSYIRRIIGSQELIKNIDRWCLWIEAGDLSKAMSITPIAERIERVRTFRLKSKRQSTIKAANTPYRFGEARFTDSSIIVIPKVSSERREYIPVGYFDAGVVIMDKAFPIYNAGLYIFALITSSMHMSWINAVSGRLKTDLSYSSSISYNTFPMRTMSEFEKEELSNKAKSILLTRENHTEKTLADMYDPDKMPEDLRQAHHELDITVDRLYRIKPYINNEERLADLFALYEKLTAADKEHK